MRLSLAVAIAGIALVAATGSSAQAPVGPLDGSCADLGGGTAGLPDEVPTEGGGPLPVTWTGGPGRAPPRSDLPTHRDRDLQPVVRVRHARTGRSTGAPADGAEAWRELPLPACFAGQVESISLDDDELVALDTSLRIFTMDNLLKEPLLFNWTRRWGPPVLDRPGLHAARPPEGLGVVGGLAARGRDVDGPGREPHGDRRRQGLAHLGTALGRPAAHLLGPLAAARRELRDVRAAPRPLPVGEPERERLHVFVIGQPRRPVHPPLRLRHLGT